MNLSVQTASPEPPKGSALFALGFRPFFLLAGIAAIVLMGLWLALWQGLIPPNAYFNLIEWHAHEMLFGYTAAVVAGFLLTAVRNWTGMAVPTGKKLALLAGLWLLARLLLVFPILPYALVALVDIAFFPVLAWSLWQPLWNGPNPVNRYFLLFFASMSLANLLVHLDAHQIAPGMWPKGIYLMLDTVILILLLVAGRVLPFFTEKAIPGSEPLRRPWVEQATFISMGLVTLSSLFFTESLLTPALLLITALVQFIRWLGWYPRRPGLWRLPILWILYLGYLWLIIGLFLRGLAGLELVNRPAALHALTAGAIGVITLGMMSRVALGHTGRNINAVTKGIYLAFILINLAAIIRVFMPLFMPEQYLLWIDLSGGLWLLSFVLFIWRYAPLLLRPRPDGRPG